MVHKTPHFLLTSLTQQTNEEMLQGNQPLTVIQEQPEFLMGSPQSITKKKTQKNNNPHTWLLEGGYKSPTAQNFIG